MWNKASRKFILAVAALLALLGGGLAGAQTDSAHSGPVMNYHRVNDRLVTGGHLLEGGAAALKKQGVEVVIDLRDDSPSGERERFAEQGIEWINIPVEWRDPRKADFDRFSEIMREHQDHHVLVQCAANYRASAMTYLYRVVAEKVPEDEAAEDLHTVWDPNDNDTWREYVNDIKMAGHK